MNSMKIFLAIFMVLVSCAHGAPIQRRSDPLYDNTNSASTMIFTRPVFTNDILPTSTALAAHPTKLLVDMPTSATSNVKAQLEHVRVGIVRPTTSLTQATPTTIDPAMESAVAKAKESLLLEVIKHLQAVPTMQVLKPTPVLSNNPQVTRSLALSITKDLAVPTSSIGSAATDYNEVNTVYHASAPIVTPTATPFLSEEMPAESTLPSSKTSALALAVTDFDSLITAMSQDLVPPLFRAASIAEMSNPTSKTSGSTKADASTSPLVSKATKSLSSAPPATTTFTFVVPTTSISVAHVTVTTSVAPHVTSATVPTSTISSVAVPIAVVHEISPA